MRGPTQRIASNQGRIVSMNNSMPNAEDENNVLPGNDIHSDDAPSPDAWIAEPVAGSSSWKIGFWVLLGIVILTWIIGGPLIADNGPDHLAVIVFFSPLMLISCLVGTYVGLGNLPWRWPVALILAPVIGWYADLSVGESSLFEFEVLVLGMVGITGVTSFVLRAWKGELKQIATGVRSVDALQFRIKDLLIWTTLAAIFVAVAQAILKTQAIDFSNYSTFSSILGMAACTAVATITNIWGMFGSRITMIKIVVVFIITFSSAVGCYVLLRPEGSFFAAALVVAQVMAVLLMFLLRRQGCRFVKRT